MWEVLTQLAKVIPPSKKEKPPGSGFLFGREGLVGPTPEKMSLNAQNARTEVQALYEKTNLLRIGDTAAKPDSKIGFNRCNDTTMQLS